jgi:putative transposase
MDWATRKVLFRRLSNTMHASFCIEALDEAIAKHGAPAIMNTNQGSQFNGAGWIARLTEAGARISMDGRRRCMDNIFMRRLWRSLKQEAVYLTELTDGFHTQTAIKEWVGVYTRIPLLSTEPRRKPKARPLLWI